MNEPLIILFVVALLGIGVGLAIGVLALAGGIERRVRALVEERISAMEHSRLSEPAVRAVPPESLVPPVASSSLSGIAAVAPGGRLAPDLIAVLTAAAYAVVGGPVVLRYALLLADDQHTAWRIVGRTDIFLSHNLRRET